MGCSPCGWSAHRSAGILTTSLKGGPGLFHLVEKRKGTHRVAKVTGVPKSPPPQVSSSRSIKEANCTQGIIWNKALSLGRERFSVNYMVPQLDLHLPVCMFLFMYEIRE